MIWKLPLAICGALLVQWKVQEFYPDSGRHFDLFFLLAIWVGIRLQPATATFAGATIGLVQDIFSVSPLLGFNGVGKALIAYTICMLGQKFILNIALLVPAVIIIGILELYLRQILRFVFLDMEVTAAVPDPFTLPLVNALLFLPMTLFLLPQRQQE